MVYWRFSIFFLSMALLTAGCATLSDWGEYDHVLITSAPSGAQVFDTNKKLLGITPNYMKIKRSRHPIILVKHKDGKTKRVELETKYWWEGSFTPNLVFLSGAPIGWIVDYTNGRSWQIVTPKVANGKGELAIPEGRKLKFVIAPAVGESERISDELSLLVEKRIKDEYPNAEIVPFEKTRDLFAESGYYYDSQLQGESLQRLWAQVTKDHGATHVIQTDYIFDDKLKKAKSLKLRSKLVNLYNLQAKSITKVYPLNETPRINNLIWRKKWGDWFQFMPNTLSMDLAGGTPEFQTKTEVIAGEYLANEDALSRAFQFLGSFGISHRDGPTSRSAWRFRFRFVPLVTATYNRIQYAKYIPLEDDVFRRLNLSAAYGAQLNYGSKYGNAYFTIAPGVAWTQVKWEGDAGSINKERSHGTVITELGYSYFLSRRWLVKVFSRRVQEDEKTWKEAFSFATGSDVKFESVSYIYGGISLGFYFPDAHHPMKNVK